MSRGIDHTNVPLPLLRVEDLSIGFGKGTRIHEVVHQLGFDLRRGETLGMVGESGSGKSVTALAMMGLLPAQGRILGGGMWFNPKAGEEIPLHTLSEAEWRKYRGKHIGLVFQEPMSALNPVFTCGFQVMEALRVHRRLSRKEARTQVLKRFDQVGLPAKTFDAYPHQISGGQKQRVVIAIAICHSPDLLIADEPTTALDVTIQQKILDLLIDIQREQGMAMLFISHDLGVVAEVSDEVLVVRNGKAMEQGRIQELYENPRHSYTRGLLACRPHPDWQVRRLPTVESVLTGKLAEPEPLAPQAPLGENGGRSPLLKVEGLSTWFKVRKADTGEKTWLKAVDEVDLQILPGETLGLVGESGCGKTTLGRSILRLVNPKAGKITFDQVDIDQLSSSALRPLRKHMQIIFQDPYSALNPRQSIGDALMEPMKVFGIGKHSRQRKERAEQLLVQVGLSSEHMKRYPHEFSGGQRQRICIARALSVEPRFIVCDESVSALDVSVQAQVLNLLKDLQDQLGLAYLFISHDLSVVKFMSDRICVMKAGRIIETGTPETVYRAPQNEYTRSLIQAIPRGTSESIRRQLRKRGKA